MKLLIVAGLFVFSSSSFASNRTCKIELRGPQREMIASMRVGEDPHCTRTIQACWNWASWYYAPYGSMCYIVRDNGTADIDYVRFPDYDNYYGYPGSPYYRVPRTQPTTSTTTTTTCQRDRYGREYCSTTVNPTPRPNPTPTPTPRPNPNPRPNPRPTPMPDPDPTPTPNPTPRPNPMPLPRPNPTPTPNPGPTPLPAPTPAPGSDAIRPIEAGETVIFNSLLQIVVSVNDTNFYTLKPVNGHDRDITKDVARQYVAVTRGCHVGFCATDSVIVLSSASYAAVAGIEYDGQFVLKTVDGNEAMTFDVNASSLAWTKGCTPETPRKVCVGNVVMKQSSRNNGYYTVVGIQLDGKVVIENNEGAKKLTINVGPESLIITR